MNLIEMAEQAHKWLRDENRGEQGVTHPYLDRVECAEALTKAVAALKYTEKLGTTWTYDTFVSPSEFAIEKGSEVSLVQGVQAKLAGMALRGDDWQNIKELPSTDLMKIGNYLIRESYGEEKNKRWISNSDGEGTDFLLADLEDCIDKFFKEKF